MQIFTKPVQIGYSWPAEDAMNIAFCEQYEGGNVLEAQVDVKQAKDLIQQLTEFCERRGKLPERLEQKPMPKVFVKALVAPGVHVCQIVNENKGPMELWLETAEGSRQTRTMAPGTSIYL